MSEAKQTTDKNTIKKWAEDRNGVPAMVEGTEGLHGGVLRIHFPAASKDHEDFKKIDWDIFFKIFEDRNLALLYQEKKESGENSTFHKFVER